ncbi:MAG: hypothetical protein EOP04_12660 [Proteobacteria bacterium]|nr:MAG: hypothetical protein EOP04_12660 [Pseudomonadota bacterium]
MEGCGENGCRLKLKTIVLFYSNEGASLPGIPPNSYIPVADLSAVFRNTTNAYKFYWFRAILSLIREGAGPFLSQQDLTGRMFELVWYPIDYYKLSFGKLDSFVGIARLVRSLPGGHDLDNRPGKPSILVQADKSFSNEEKRMLLLQLNKLYQYVPFRFIRPFLQKETQGLKDSQVDRKVIEEANRLSQSEPSRCPYHFVKGGIQINGIWFEYFRAYLSILEAFTNWHLVQYLQRNNPNISGISVKIFKPEERKLTSVRHAWEMYRTVRGPLTCIYSNELLTGGFSLDHFIPWSFVAHDLNWNLTPVSREVNSKKNDRLPQLHYLSRLASLQYDFVQTLFDVRGLGQVLEEYSMLFREEAKTIKSMPFERFEQKFNDTFIPMYQIAKNAGFREWV